MNRRETLKLMGGMAAAGMAGLPAWPALAADKTMVTVVKIAGIPWFNALESGVKKAGSEFHIDASMTGPANVDPVVPGKTFEFPRDAGAHPGHRLE